MSTDRRSLSYHLRFREPQAGLVDVALEVTGPGDRLEIWMPVWTPGSYLIREFSRNLQDLAATGPDGEPLPSTKTAKNAWVVETGGASAVRIAYRIYGRELSVRTNFVTGDFAFLNGAATFLTVRGREREPHRVRISLPRGWAGVWTPLPPVEDAGGGDAAAPAGSRTATEDERVRAFAFAAADLDELVDSPVLAGSPAVHDFAVDGIPISLVNLGEGGLWDGRRAARDVQAIVETCRAMYGSLPFPRYLFLNLIVESRGGLEHRNSCVMMTSRYAYRRRAAYVSWLGLVSHELFHAWNVKRSRPAALGPFDYEQENYSRALWVAEGITAYYTDLIPVRAGLTTVQEYLDALGSLIQKLQATPGRAHQSLEESSFDAWIKLYRPDENTANTTVSYYVKGAVVAWLLDREIRSATSGRRSLDDLMRLLFERYSGERGFTDRDVQEAAGEIAGRDLGTFFDRYIRGRQEIDYTPALEAFGLRFQRGPGAEEDGPGKRSAAGGRAAAGIPGKDEGIRPGRGTDKQAPPPVWLGLDAEGQNGKLIVTAVRDDGPSREAGIEAGDEILALGGYRVGPQRFEERLHQYAPGDRLEILIARRDAVRIVPVTLAEPRPEWKLEPDPGAPPEAVASRRRWLSGGRD